MATGSIITGWLSDRFQCRKMLLIIAGLLSIPATWSMGLTTNIWQLAMLMAIMCFFLHGMAVALIGAMAGLFAGEAERGKVFGIIQMTASMGALIGGSISGPIADQWGYPTMFFVVAFICTILPTVSLFLEDKILPREKGKKTKTQVSMGGYFWLLIIAQTLVTIVFFVGHLTRSLAMTDLRFPSAAISRVVAVGGAVTLPFPFLIGWLSDKFGRKRLLALCYLAGIIGISSQAISVSWWHFCLATILIAFVTRVGGGVGSALVSDLVPKESLGMGIAFFQAGSWVAGIIGWSITGYAIQNFGLTSSMIMAVILPLAAIILLIFIRPAVEGKKLAGSI
jgi:MFS family permease